MAVVSVEGLRKEYGGVAVLDGVDCSVDEGEVYALVGPNGGGKSTLLRILATLTEPTAGTVELFGTPVAERGRLRRRIAYAPEEPPLYDALSGWEQLTHVDALRGEGRAGTDALERAVEQFGLSDAIDDRQETYSTGMRQKVSLIQTLTHEPELALLDEPTGGLDTASVETVETVVDELTTEGTTVVVATHDDEFRRRVADKVGRISGGDLTEVPPTRAEPLTEDV